LPNLQDLSDHAPLLVHIIIKEEFIQEKKLAIVKNSEKEKEFVNKLKDRVSGTKMANIHSHKMLQAAT